MTGQISDSVRFQGARWTLAAASAAGLFDPEDYGMQLRAASTACWRGYTCTYAVKKDRLLLVELHAASSDPLPALGGRTPEAPSPRGGFQDMFTARYRGMNLQVPYTGGLLLANGFINKLYVHLGFQEAWKYRRVWELVFEQGALTTASDRSEAACEARASILAEQERERLVEGRARRHR